VASHYRTDYGIDQYPPDPGSGIGGVTITGINGVDLPPVVPPSQIAMTSSRARLQQGQSNIQRDRDYKNISTSAISGPLQIVFFGMTSGVTLMNATGDLSGTPYMTVPNITSLAPGQSSPSRYGSRIRQYNGSTLRQ